MRCLPCAVFVVACAAATAFANGRPPASSTINVRAGHPSDVVGGMTFGLVITHDGGTTWQWMCEKAIGYGGIYDPIYAYTASGAIFATTVDGLRVNRDGCTFAATPLGATFVSALSQGPDGALYAATFDTTSSSIHKSTDDGATFPVAASPGQANDYWQSIVAAPSDPLRVYLSGYRFDAGTGRAFLMFASTTGAASFSPLPVTDFATSSSSTIDIVGVSPTDPDVVFARVTMVNGNAGDAIYRSTNGGGSFTKVFESSASLNAFVVRANGTVVIGTPNSEMFTSSDGGMTFQPVVDTPAIHASCMAEVDGVLWACTQNYGSDAMGIATSSDAVTWSKKLHYQDIARPVDCMPTTDQFATCQTMLWCTLAAQLGVTSQQVPCASLIDVGGDITAPPKKGCCEADTGAGGIVVCGAVVALLMRRRHRRV